jgi:hypothetical protein
MSRMTRFVSGFEIYLLHLAPAPGIAIVSVWYWLVDGVVNGV